MAKITLNGKEFEGISVATQHTGVLLVKAKNGLLGCGYFSVATADKVGDALAVVTGVGSFDDMLAAPVKGVSPAAAALGVSVGMSGREALLLMA